MNGRGGTVCLGYDYFKDQSLRAFPSHTSDKIGIAVSGWVRFVLMTMGPVHQSRQTEQGAAPMTLLELLQTALGVTWQSLCSQLWFLVCLNVVGIE